MTTTAVAATGSTTHILVIPYPAQGHMIPILDLAHHLASTNLFSLTVVTTPKNLPLLSPLLSSHPPSAVSPLVLPFPPSPDLPPGAENSKDLPLSSFRPLMFALSHLQHPLRSWFDSHSSPPVAVIYDFFLGWTHRFATDLGIKPLVFCPSGAMATSVIFSLWRNMPQEADFPNGREVSFSDVPNSPKYPWSQLSTVFRSYVAGETVSEFIKEGFRDIMKSWGLIVNSFHELESDYWGHLRSVFGHDRVWAVGPLVPSEEKLGPNGHKERGGSSSVEVDEVLSWLDTCRDDEVVYISFGTQAVLTGRQMEVVAEALDRSGVRFIWSVRDPSMTRHFEADPAHGAVPVGFEDRVAGRGLVIKGWAPQVSILKHRAVGAFLTHCGWNSTLEGIAAGVELLAWPMGADQFSNATLLVDYLKVGVRVCEGPRTVPDPIELARVLVESVNHKGVHRRRILQLRNNAVEAVNENGSSHKELLRLVKSLTGLRTTPEPTTLKGNTHVDLE